MLVTAMPGWSGGTAGADLPDPIHPAAAAFALGRPFGLLPPSDEVCRPSALPFGLRRAVAGVAVPVGDLTSYGFDHGRQIGMVYDGERLVPLWRHTTGQTRTTTNPDGHGGPDSDTDHRED